MENPPTEQPGDASLPLRETQRKDVEQRVAPSAAVVHETIRREGEDELRRPASALAWSGLAAGLSMGFSLVAEGLIRSYVPDVPWSPLLVKLGYTVGFLIVILGRQQLFTENTLTPVLPLLVRRDRTTLFRLLRLWVIVLLTNLIGTLVFAWVLGHTEIFSSTTRAAFAQISHETLSGDFLTVFLRAIFAGWLIALMVWLLPFAETARVGVIIIIAFLVGLGGFSHIIVGSVEVLFGVTAGDTSWSAYFGQFLIPTLLGNIVGGVSLVAALNNAQVTSGGAGNDD